MYIAHRLSTWIVFHFSCVCILSLLSGAYTFLLTTLFPNRTNVQETGTFTLWCSYDIGSFRPDQILCNWQRKYYNDTMPLDVATWRNNTIVFQNTVNGSDFNITYDLAKRLFTLEKTSVQRSDHNSTWMCSIFTDGQSTSNPSTLYVNVPISGVGLLLPNESHLSAIESSNSTFICNTSEGRPTPWISWYKRNESTEENITYYSQMNSKRLTNRLTITDSTLHFDLLREDNGSRIYCKAGNTGSEVLTSREILLHVQFPVTKPSLYIGQRHVTGTRNNVFKGDSFEIRCASHGDPSPIYYWTDGKYARRWNGPVLIIANTTEKDVGRFWCHVHNIMTSSTKTRWSNNSNFIIVEVLVSPGFPKLYFHTNGQTHALLNTTHLSAVIEDTFSVSCTSTGYPLPNCSCSGIPVVSNTQTKADVEEDKRITCRAESLLTDYKGQTRNGTVTAFLELDWLYSPRNVSIAFRNGTDLSDTLSIVENSSFNLTCTAKSNPPSTYKWTGPFSSDNGRLVIMYVQREHKGRYTCHANNTMVQSYGNRQMGYGSKDINLDVLYRATVKRFTINELAGKHVTVDEFQTVTFRCSVDSYPDGSVRIVSSEKELASNSSTLSLTYVLHDVSCLHTGNYSCEGRNEYNYHHESKSVMTMFVNCSPRPSPTTQIDHHIISTRQSPATIKFTALAYPEPTFQWYKYSSIGYLALQSSDRINISSNGLYTSFTISDVSETDYGEYMLNISNSLGSYNQTFSLSAAVFTTESVYHQNIAGLVAGSATGVITIIAVIAFSICLYQKRYRKANHADKDRKGVVKSYAEGYEMNTVVEENTCKNSVAVYEEITPKEDRGIIDRIENDYERLKLDKDIKTTERKEQNSEEPKVDKDDVISAVPIYTNLTL